MQAAQTTRLQYNLSLTNTKLVKRAKGPNQISPTRIIPMQG